MAGAKTPWENPTENVTASEQCRLAPGGLTQAKRACWNVLLVLFLGAKVSHQHPALFRGGLVLDSESLQSPHQLLPFLWAADGGILPSYPCSYDVPVLFPCYYPQPFRCLILLLKRGQQCWSGLLPGQREGRGRRPRMPAVLHARFCVYLCALGALCGVWKAGWQSPAAVLAATLVEHRDPQRSWGVSCNAAES